MPSSQGHAINLRGPKAALKKNSWDTVRVWWVPILARGKLHVEMLGEDFPGETQEGAAIMVRKIRAAINVRFPGGDAPRTLFSDRGPGFFNPGTGGITAGFKQALREHRLRAFMGEDASQQPGELQELMLHETAVAWCRYRLARCVPQRPWLETGAEYGHRLKKVVADINRSLDVEGLCQELPCRVEQLLVKDGGRLPK